MKQISLRNILLFLLLDIGLFIAVVQCDWLWAICFGAVLIQHLSPKEDRL